MKIYILSGWVFGIIFIVNVIIMIFGNNTIGARGQTIEPTTENIVKFLIYAILAFSFSLYFSKKNKY